MNSGEASYSIGASSDAPSQAQLLQCPQVAAVPVADRRPKPTVPHTGFACRIRQDALWDHSCGCHPICTANLGPGCPGLGGVLSSFPRTLAPLPLCQEPGTPPRSGLARLAHRSFAFQRQNFCPTCPETGAVVVPTCFAGVVVMRLLCALLAFQGPVVQGNIRVVPQHPSTAGQW